MDGTVGGLSCNKFVERVPGYSLNVMTMLGNLANQLTCMIQRRAATMIGVRIFHTCVCVEYSCGIVHPSSDEEHSVRGPRQIVDLSSC
jgi:hypothetical protein